MKSKESKLGHAQSERIAFIEFRLWFLGEFKRQDLMDRFGTSLASTTRDINIYKSMAEENMIYDGSSKTYLISKKFKPVFDYSPEKVFAWLNFGFSQGMPGKTKPLISLEIPNQMNKPSTEILAIISRAIYQKKAIRIKYVSLEKGMSKREIVPFALVDTGLRWHVRAYDRNSQEFRDFVITRIVDPEILEKSAILDEEKHDQDLDWNRVVELEIVPHPKVAQPKAIEMDYGMKNGKAKLRIRGAIAGYFLRLWNVDCSKDHHLDGPEFQLWLNNPLTLYGVNNAKLAPGWDT